MVWQLKLLAVIVVFAPIFCAALLEDAFNSNVELLAEETDLSAVNIRAPRTAGYFYAHEHYPRFHIPSSPKGYLPPPRYNHQSGYGNGYESDDESDYDYEDSYEGHRHRSHHHHHHRTGGSHRQVTPNRDFSNDVNSGGFIQVPNSFKPTNNVRPSSIATPQGPPTRTMNTFLRPNTGGSFQTPNTVLPSNIDRPIVAIPSQTPPVINPRPVVSPRPAIITTSLPSDPPTQVVATPPTSTAAPAAEGDPYNIDIRFGN